MENLQKLIIDIHETAKDHGWWEKEKSFGEVIALIHSELSEALEFERSKNNLQKDGINHLFHYTGAVDLNTEVPELDKLVFGKVPVSSNTSNDFCKKPDGVLPELADAVIRIFDYIGFLGKEEDFVNIMLEKHEFNKTRSYKHGNKAL